MHSKYGMFVFKGSPDTLYYLADIELLDGYLRVKRYSYKSKEYGVSKHVNHNGDFQLRDMALFAELATLPKDFHFLNKE